MSDVDAARSALANLFYKSAECYRVHQCRWHRPDWRFGGYSLRGWHRALSRLQDDVWKAVQTCEPLIERHRNGLERAGLRFENFTALLAKIKRMLDTHPSSALDSEGFEVTELENARHELLSAIPAAQVSLPPARPPLSEMAAAVYEILLALPEHRALTGSKILDALQQQNPPMYTEQSTLTSRIIPELKPYGVENSRRKGYRIPPSKRPLQMQHKRG